VRKHVGKISKHNYITGIEVPTYMALFHSLACFEEGLAVLSEFARTANRAFAEPDFLAHVVLVPVNTIVDCLMDICESNVETGISKKAASHQYYRLAILFKYWYLKQYIKVLTKTEVDETPREFSAKEIKANADYLGQESGLTQKIGKLGDIPSF
jgi:hypothetical protein